MVILTLFCLLLLILYACLITGYWLTWQTMPVYSSGNHHRPVGFSVIVPFRNEQEMLQDLLDALLDQDYPATHREFILVDDHSQDQSCRIIREACTRHSCVHLIRLPADEAGKKKAIQAGIRAARFEYVVTTDADCIPGVNWLSVLASCCAGQAPAMVIGLVAVKTNGQGWLDYFQQLETLSLVGSGAASAGRGKPLFCSGANLCYAKAVYHRYEDPFMNPVLSGEDTFFLLQVKKEFSNRIQVLKSREAIVYTKPEKNLREFIRQRSRWTSKSMHYRDPEVLYASLVVFLTNAAWVLSGILLAGRIPPWLFIAFSAVKVITDGLFLHTLLTFFGFRFRPMYFLLSEMVYPFYLLLTVFIGFALPVSWKGRKSVAHL